MTVKQLINILLTMPMDAIVCSSEEGNAYDLEEKDIFYWNNQDDLNRYPNDNLEFFQAVQIG